MKFQRYKRGMLVMVNFTPSTGSELRGNHLAIVLTKKDTPNNSVLTLIPLSSKEKPYYLSLGDFLWKTIQPKFIIFRDEIIKRGLEHKELFEFYKLEYKRLNGLDGMDEVTAEYAKLIENQDRLIIEQDKTSKNFSELENTLSVYIKMNKNSYAMIQNISTLSKLRILKPLNKYDPILNVKISNELLDKIDEKIIELFTGK